MQNQENNKQDQNTENEGGRADTDIKAENGQGTDEKAENDKKSDPEARYTELNDKYLRLYSKFDNYRKRTIKERSDLKKTAAEDVFKSVLPIIDDLERAIKA